jgi:hypothetical protein
MAEEKDSGGAEWMQKLWRPAMGWMYMIICLADMIVFPVLWSLLQAVTHTAITQWNPLTLQGAGLFHIAMGAVLGISAFGRTQEKLAGTAANPTAPTSSPAPSFGGTPSGFNSSSSGTPAFGVPASGGFGASSGGFGATTSPAPAASGFGGGGFGSTPPATTASGKKIVPDFGQPAI